LVEGRSANKAHVRDDSLCERAIGDSIAHACQEVYLVRRAGHEVGAVSNTKQSLVILLHEVASGGAYIVPASGIGRHDVWLMPTFFDYIVHARLLHQMFAQVVRSHIHQLGGVKRADPLLG